MEGFMACETVLQRTSRNTLYAVTSLAVSFPTYQRETLRSACGPHMAQ